MQKEIFIISELFYPNKTSTAYIMTEIAKRIAKNEKCKVNVVCADVIYDDNFDKEACANDLIELNVINATKLIGNKNSIFGKIKNAVQTCYSFGNIILKKVKSKDTVFAVTNPFLLVVVLAFIRLFKKFNYILLVHDVFPENIIPAGLGNKKNISFKIIKMIYDWAYNKADKLIVLGRDMEQLITNKIGSSAKVHIIENWFDTDLIIGKEVDRNSYFGVNLDDKIVIGFAGNIGRVQNLTSFLNIFKKVNNPKLHFVIIGDGAMREEVENVIRENKLSNVHYLGTKPRMEQSVFLNCCDIGLITLSKGMFGLGVPSKTYNLLALGKPIIYIGDEKSEIDMLIDEYNIGWSFNWDHESQIIDFMNTLNSLDISKTETSKLIAQEKFSENIILSKINNLIFS